MKIAVGVDIGGSHISSAAVNMETLKIIPGTHFNGYINSKASKEIIFEGWAHIINKTLKMLKNKDILGIGMAMPGPFEYSKGTAMFQGNDKYEALYKVSVANEFPQYLCKGNLSLRFLNDASSFGLGGALTKNAGNTKRVLAVTLGTGFGAAFLKDRIPVSNGGSVPEGGCLWDKKFKEGIADDYFSTRWFLKKHMELTGYSDIKGVKDLVYENNNSTYKIFDEFAENLSGFMLPYLQKFDPDLLILGGNIAKSYELFLPAVVQNWRQRDYEITIAVIENSEEIGIIGSSYLFQPEFWKKVKKELPVL